MGALDTALSGAPTVDPDTPQAPAPVAAPGPPALDFTPLTAPGGALAQSLQIGAATNKAANDQVTGSPLFTAYQAEKAKSDQANAAAAANMQANMGKIAAIEGQPDLPHPSIPRLKPLPVETEQPDYVAAAKADPLRALGQYLPLLAALGGLRTAQPATAALNAATAAVNAARSKDQTALTRAHEEWVDNTKTAIQQNQDMATEYKDALEDRSLSMADRMAKVQGLAAANKDEVTLAALKAGNPAGILSMLEMTSHASTALAGVVAQTEHEATAQAQMKDESLRGWAELQVRNLQAQAQLGKTSPNDIAGQIFAKVASSGYDSLSPVEKDALSRLQQYEVGLHPAPAAALISQLTGAQPGAPAAPAAAPTGDTGAGAVATTPGTSAANPIVPATKAAAAALPSGTWIKDPAGHVFPKK